MKNAGKMLHHYSMQYLHTSQKTQIVKDTMWIFQICCISKKRCSTLMKKEYIEAKRENYAKWKVSKDILLKFILNKQIFSCR